MATPDVTRYDPIVLRVDMNRWGYRSVTISTAPGRRVTVMLCRVGISRDEAVSEALVMIDSMPGVSEVRH